MFTRYWHRFRDKPTNTQTIKPSKSKLGPAECALALWINLKKTTNTQANKHRQAKPPGRLKWVGGTPEGITIQDGKAHPRPARGEEGQMGGELFLAGSRNCLSIWSFFPFLFWKRVHGLLYNKHKIEEATPSSFSFKNLGDALLPSYRLIVNTAV